MLSAVSSSELVARELTGAAAFAAVQRSLYGPMLAAEHAAGLALLSAVATSARVLCVQRPRDRWSLDDVLAAVLTDADRP